MTDLLWTDIFIAAVIILVLSLAFLFAIDASSTTAVVPGVVTDKHYAPPYTTYVLIACGKNCTTLVPEYHPAIYSVYCDIDGGVVRIDTSSGLYDELKLGDAVRVQYSRGRLSNSLYGWSLSH